jgi:PfaD family protein
LKKGIELGGNSGAGASSANNQFITDRSEGFAASLLREFRAPLFAGFEGGTGRVHLALKPESLPVPLAMEIPGIYPEWLGDRTFCTCHGTRFPYVGGAMARGIASVELVVELGRCGMLGFFGAAGLRPERVEQALRSIGAALGETAAWGCNLIHSPDQPGLEERLVDLYLALGVRRVSAAAFMGPTPALVRYALTGIHRDGGGTIRRKNYLFAKLSRTEVARQFLAPAPAAMVAALRSRGALSAAEADLAARIPLSEDLEVEGDSGGHTDSRPLAPLFTGMLRLREDLSRRHGYTTPIRIGAAGGLGTPEAAAAAFAMGASHIVIGSVHQSACEAGTSPRVKAMLAGAGVADFMTTPSADMFELGARVQVLKQGTLMPVRGNHLLELFRRYEAVETLPAQERADLEENLFRAPVAAVWREIEAFFGASDPAQLERAGRDPRHRMALLFRWYLGQSSQWPVQGAADRVMDYQIWSGPAMGAFNDWVRGSFLEDPGQRSVRQIALNLMEGAAFVTRQHQLRAFGLLPEGRCHAYRPELLEL